MTYDFQKGDHEIRYYANGKMAEENRFKNSKKVSSKRYTQNGILIQETQYLDDGFFIRYNYDKTGKMTNKCTYESVWAIGHCEKVSE